MALVTADDIFGADEPPVKVELSQHDFRQWMRDRETYFTPAMFGGVADASLVDGAGTSASAALQAAIDAAEAHASGQTIPEVLIPGGVWLIDESVVTSKQIRIRGVGKVQTILLIRLSVRDGTTPGLDLTLGGWLDDLQIRGYVSNDTNWFLADSVGVRLGTTIEAKNVDFFGFEKVITWAGGYYHKFTNCVFQRSLKVFPAWSANNVSFVACKVSLIDTFFEYNGGIGPVSALGCSFESWTGRLFSGISGARAAITLVGSYVENYPGSSAGMGLPDAAYDSGIGFVGVASLSVVGCMISLKGVLRFLDNGVSALDSLVSLGNRFTAFNTAPNNTCDYVYKAGSFNTVNVQDHFSGTFAGTAYISGTYTYPAACRVINPATFVDDSPTPAWIAGTYENAWVAVGGSYPGARYRRRAGHVELSGHVNGGSATGATVMTLPTGYRPLSPQIHTAATVSGDIVSIQVTIGGAVNVLDSPYTIAHVSLDGIRIYLS